MTEMQIDELRKKIPGVYVTRKCDHCFNPIMKGIVFRFSGDDDHDFCSAEHRDDWQQEQKEREKSKKKGNKDMPKTKSKKSRDEDDEEDEELDESSEDEDEDEEDSSDENGEDEDEHVRALFFQAADAVNPTQPWQAEVHQDDGPGGPGSFLQRGEHATAVGPECPVGAAASRHDWHAWPGNLANELCKPVRDRRTMRHEYEANETPISGLPVHRLGILQCRTPFDNTHQ